MRPIFSIVKEKYPSVDGNEIRKILREIIGKQLLTFFNGNYLEH